MFPELVSMMNDAHTHIVHNLVHDYPRSWGFCGWMIFTFPTRNKSQPTLFQLKSLSSHNYSSTFIYFLFSKRIPIYLYPIPCRIRFGYIAPDALNIQFRCMLTSQNLFSFFSTKYIYEFSMRGKSISVHYFLVRHAQLSTFYWFVSNWKRDMRKVVCSGQYFK